MHLSTVIAGAAAFFLQAGAMTLSRQDPHITNFRIWSEEECGANGILGVWTITKSQINVCQPTFNAPDNVVKAIYLNEISEGCKLFVYPTPDCGEDGRLVGVRTCEKTNTADNFLSFQISCS